MHRIVLAFLLWTLSPAPLAAEAVRAPRHRGDAILALPDPLRRRLHDEVLIGVDTPDARFVALLRFLHDPDGLAMRYADDATLTVAEAAQAREANCVTFTLLFLALAREAGLDAEPMRIRRILSWRRDGATVYLDSHVFARVRIGRRAHAVDFAVEPVLPGEPPEAIDDARLLGLYWNNLAMDRLADGDTVQASALLQRALALEPAYPPYLSNAGVIALRAGDPGGAARAYASALARAPEDAGALFNSVALARRMGDTPHAEALQRRLERVQRRDPLQQILQGMAREREGRPDEALIHYRRAVRLRDDEPRFHAALARACTAAGDGRCADRAWSRAIALASGALREDYRREREAARVARR